MGWYGNDGRWIDREVTNGGENVIRLPWHPSLQTGLCLLGRLGGELTLYQAQYILQQLFHLSFDGLELEKCLNAAGLVDWLTLLPSVIWIVVLVTTSLGVCRATQPHATRDMLLCQIILPPDRHRAWLNDRPYRAYGSTDIKQAVPNSSHHQMKPNQPSCMQICKHAGTTSNLVSDEKHGKRLSTQYPNMFYLM
ncbi:hypothetical protein J6590_077225 [Homalodisca vitripennis]|nr:hypothetical protein J6590_077225 [Homalodisca vitripennis]